MQLALALDLGTTTMTGLAVAADGRVVGRVTRPHECTVAGRPERIAEQDPRRLKAVALQVLRELAQSSAGMPHCLGVTGQMHGTLLIDRRRRPLSNLITWQDRRATLPTAPGAPSFLDELLARCEPDAIERTGCRLAAGYLAVTLFVLQQRGEIPQTAERAAFPADWFAAELCDVPVATDRSNAASSGVYDLERDCWSEALIAACGVSPSLFPEVRESGSVLGLLSPESAAATGLPAGMPVCVAIGDNQAAVLGSVPADETAIQINIGTGGQINWPAPSFVRLSGMETRYLPHGRYMLVGAGQVGGDAYAWVNRTICQWLESLRINASSEDVYARMNELAAALPRDNDGLQCEPKFRGTRQEPQARGIFRGISVENFTIGHVSRAVLQGIADGLYDFYERAGEARPRAARRIIGSGNGLRQNPLLASIVAETFGREVWLTEHPEEAAYGTALLAGATTGLWPSLAAAGAVIRHRKQSTPSPLS